jgi:CHASE1-domain containing sensor protein
MPFQDYLPAPEGAHGDALRAPLASPAWALVVLLAGLLFTAELARREWIAAAHRAQTLHHGLADAAQARVRAPLETVAMALRSMQTVFLSNDRMDQAQFAQYQDNLRSRELVPGYVVTAFAQRQDSEGPGRAASYAYRFVTPLHGNEPLLGLDIATQPQNLAALQRARDADAASISAPFTLLQFRSQGVAAARGVTVRLPVYSHGPRPATQATRRAREIGALAISLRLEPLLRQALDGRILELMHVQIRDLDAEPGQATVFETGPVPADAGAAQVRQVEFSADAAGSCGCGRAVPWWRAGRHTW